jgi:uncharacterized membrane protein
MTMQVARFAIAGLGVLVALGIFLWMRPHRLERVLAPWARGILAGSVLCIVVGAGTLVVARYATWHSFVHDLGSYDQKVWTVSRQSDPRAMLEQTYRGGVEVAPCGAQRHWGICHFQPLYVVYAFLYRIYASPIVLLVAQVLLVAGGAIACFALAQLRLGPGAAALTTILYVLHPAVQFNAMLDFRPDHIAIPFLLWAYVLAARGRGWGTAAAAGVPGLAKESLLLAVAGFGLFLATVPPRRRLLGVGLFLAALIVFGIVMFYVLAGPERSEATFMVGRFFSGGGDFFSFGLMARKIFYIVLLLAPLAFLPLLAPLQLLPSLPAVGIALMSNDATHASIQSQYSAAVVGPMFAALCAVLPRVFNRFRDRGHPIRVLTALTVVSASFSVAFGPTPSSLRFWHADIGRQWHYSQYLPDRQASLNTAARLIPSDPAVMVVTQNDLNSASLAHRPLFFAFPNGIDRADYVLLDTRRMPFVYWVAEDARYYQTLVDGLRTSDAYRVAFDREGVLLFMRVGERRPGQPEYGTSPPIPTTMPK